MTNTLCHQLMARIVGLNVWGRESAQKSSTRDRPACERGSACAVYSAGTRVQACVAIGRAI